MSKYKGKNETKITSTLAVDRANYKVNSFRDEIGEVPKNVRDFNFLERTLYGRINQSHDTIYLRETKLKLVPQDGETFFVLDFVAEQLRLFKNKIKQSVSFGKLPSDDPFLSSIVVYKAYEDPVNLYKEYINNQIALFNNRLKPDSIADYGEWVKQFVSFQTNNGARFPTTFSSFQRSSRSSIFTSGLAISIANLDCGNDEQKSDFFLENKHLEYYTKVAMQFGFYVNKSCPWILISDLESPVTIEQRRAVNLTTLSETFTNRFQKCYEKDIIFLKQVLEDGYKTFIANNPIKKDFNTKCNKTIKNISYRYNNINNIIYNNNFYINLYITFKNIEEYNYLSEPEAARVKQKAKIFAKKLDNSRAMDYINVQFQDSYRTRTGTLNDLLNKQRKASEG
jgi:hypothetical protein